MPQYPLGENDRENIRSKTGKKLSELTLDEILKGHVSAEDIKISPEQLRAQGRVALEQNDSRPMQENFERAAELTGVPDDVILKMYNSLRPNRSTKEQLLNMAAELEQKYQAPTCAKLVREAAEVYEKRGILLKKQEA